MFGDIACSWKRVLLPLAARLYVQIITYVDRQYYARKPLTTEEYLAWIARLSQRSEYDLFFVSAEDWNVPDQQIEEDFKTYLRDDRIP